MDLNHYDNRINVILQLLVYVTIIMFIINLFLFHRIYIILIYIDVTNNYNFVLNHDGRYCSYLAEE